MSIQPNETEFRPAVLRDALRHHAVLILLLAIIVGAIGGAAGLLLPSPRQSTATVLISPLYGNPFSPEFTGDQLTNLETEAQIVATDAVAGLVAKQLRTAVTPSELVRSVRGSLQQNTQVIKITYTAATSRTAHDSAQAFAEAFLAFRQQRAKQRIDEQVKILQRQYAATRALQIKASAAAARPATKQVGTEQVKQYSGEMTRLTSAIAQQQAIPTDPGQVISPATTPGELALSSAILYAIIGAIAGLLIGVLAAITRERLDDRVRDTSDFDRLSIPSLGSMALPTAWSPDVAQIPEDHRRVRTTLMTVLPSVPATIVVGRPDVSGMAPTIVGPIALSLARSGVRVCVVDSAVTDWLGQELVPNTDQGLASVLLEDVPIEKTLRQPVPGLGVVPRGRWSGEAADQLGNIRMRRAVNQLRKYFDIVIISTPSMQNADGQVLSRMADGVVLESSAMSTTNADLLRTVDQLSRAHVPVLGSVLVSRGPSRRRLRRKSPQVARPVARPATVPSNWQQPAENITVVPADTPPRGTSTTNGRPSTAPATAPFPVPVSTPGSAFGPPASQPDRARASQPAREPGTKPAREPDSQPAREPDSRPVGTAMPGPSAKNR